LSSSTDREPGFAAWVLGRPLSLALGLVILIQFGSWLPHYLTWPYWADHDAFANAARAWDLGEKPYRDTRLNNFPGTIYVFYLLGKAAGWGKPWTLYAFDSTLLAALVVVLILWSRRTFGRAWPGLIGSLAFLSYYLSLDYSHAAQRDWQGPCLTVAGLLIAQGWPGRPARLASALLAALGFSIRPQVVLFLPALLLAVATPGAVAVAVESKALALRRGVSWLATFASFAALMFLPLAIDGTFDDFLHSLRHVAYGSTYNKTTPASVARAWLLQAAAFRWLVVPAAILLLAGKGGPGRPARVWLVALAGASLYKPSSPMAHSYLDIPLVLTWSVNLAVLAGSIAAMPGTSAATRLAGVLTLLGLGMTTIRPEFCVVGPNREAASTLRSGIEPEAVPPGYRHGSVVSSAFYPWADYRAALIYLRNQTRPSTKVANALKGDPAIVSEVDRPSAFPAESIAWLRMVNRQDEPAFVESLEKATDSVVVWSPGEDGPDPLFQIPRIEATIRRLYQFEARFGAIEIWRRVAEGPIVDP